MPTDYDRPQMEAPRAVNQLYAGQLGLQTAPVPQITRERFVELVALASETVQWLEEKGLKQGEQCEFRQIAERLWFAPKGETK